jgi:hypothetical protein
MTINKCTDYHIGPIAFSSAEDPDHSPQKLRTKNHAKIKRMAIAPITLCMIIGGSGVAAAFDLGFLGGFLDTMAPVLKDYTDLDISKYAGYLDTFNNVLSSVEKGGIKNILGAVGSINRSLGDSGVVIPSKLASDVLNVVSEKYASGGSNTLAGIGQSNAGQRALDHAQNVSHRAYVESVLGKEGQGNIKKGVEGSADLVKSSAEIAQKGAKSTVSQKKLDAIALGQVILAAGNAQLYGKLTEIQINGVQQTEIETGLLEYFTHDRTAKTLGSAASSISISTSSGVFSGLAAKSPDSTDSGITKVPVSDTQTATIAPPPTTTKPDLINDYFNQNYNPTDRNFGTTQGVPVNTTQPVPLF